MVKFKLSCLFIIMAMLLIINGCDGGTSTGTGTTETITTPNLTMSDLVGNWYIYIEDCVQDTSDYYIYVTLDSLGTFEFEVYRNGYIYDSGSGMWGYYESDRSFYAAADADDMCEGTISANSTIDSFAVDGMFYGDPAQYEWLRMD